MLVEICDMCYYDHPDSFDDGCIPKYSAYNLHLCKFHYLILKNFVEHSEHWDYMARPGDEGYNKEIGLLY